MILPSRITMNRLSASRSASGISEQRLLDSDLGSIGTVSPGRYSDVPRACASWSMAEPGRT